MSKTRSLNELPLFAAVKFRRKAGVERLFHAAAMVSAGRYGVYFERVGMVAVAVDEMESASSCVMGMGLEYFNGVY